MPGWISQSIDPTPVPFADTISIDYHRLSMNNRLVDRTRAERWASWFRAIGDPTRVLVLNLLSTAREPLSVGQITDALDVGQSTVSHHLRKLAEVGFVQVEHVGTSSLWRVNEACIECFPSAAEMVMGRVPDDFARALEAHP